MKSQKILWQVVCLVVCIIFQTQAQTKETNVVVINGIYEAIENNNTPSIIASWVPDMKWYQSSNNFNEKEPYVSSNEVLKEMYVLLENEWQHIIFKNMNIQEIEGNVVLVTGIINGRKY